MSYTKSEDYLDGTYLGNDHWNLRERSEKLLDVMEKHLKGLTKKSSIIELGCSAGRNLKFLHDEGFTNLTGLEMSPKAYHLIGKYAKHKILGRFEEKVDGLKKYDLVISMSFLQERIERTGVEKLPRIVGKYLITIDDPANDFQETLLANGLKLIEEIPPSGSSPFSTPIKIYEK